MTQDEIIAMAKEAGWQNSAILQAELRGLNRFAALVAAKEREACAKFLETTDICGDAVMDTLAAAIRSRSTT